MLFSVCYFGFSQTKLAKLTFEYDPTDTDPAITDVSYTTSIATGIDDSDPAKPLYFLRATNATIGVDFNAPLGLGNYYFAAKAKYVQEVKTLEINPINITGYDNLEFRVYLAEENNDGGGEGWDQHSTASKKDYVHFEYDIDSKNSYENIFSVVGSGSSSSNNQDAQIDTNQDGFGDGAMLTDTFEQFNFPIGTVTTTGSSLRIRIEFNLNQKGEDIAIDNIEIWGTPISDCTGAVTTWTDGAGWDNGVPDIGTKAVINGTYDTSVDGGSFTACSLEVQDHLIVADGTYIEISQDVIVKMVLNL